MSQRVQLFVTCLIDGFYPAVGEAVVTVLERAGVEVAFPFDQTCCGQPPFNAGFQDESRRIVHHMLDVLDATEGTIVVPSGSCADMIIHHAPDLVAADPQRSAQAARVAARVREFTTFLVEDLGLTDVGAELEPGSPTTPRATGSATSAFAASLSCSSIRWSASPAAPSLTPKSAVDSAGCLPWRCLTYRRR